MRSSFDIQRCTVPCLQRLHVCGVVIEVMDIATRVLLNDCVEAENVRRICEELVREQMGDLLSKSLRCQVF